MVQLADGRVAQASIVGQEPDTDLAILVLSVGNLPIMPMGRSDTLRVGDIVLAIGNPQIHDDGGGAGRRASRAA